MRHGILDHRQLIASVDGDGRGEYEAFDIMVDRRIDEVNAPDQIVGVIKALDEMAQTFGGVRGEMEDIFKMMVGKKASDQFGIGNGTFHELDAARNVVAKTAAQIVQTDHLMPQVNQVTTDMGADESGRAGY